MPTSRELRPYQSEAAQAVFNEWGSETRRTAVVLPTGTGKSTVIGKVASESARMGLRVVMLAHRGELLDQMADTVTAVAPDLPRPGIVRAEHDESHAQIIAASFQTLTNDYRLGLVGERQVVLCDETHHVTAASYRRVVESFGADTFFCGFTATLRREDGKALRDMIDSVAYEKNLRWAIGENYLVKPTGITVKIPDLDLGKVKTTAGDFQQNGLAEVMEAETPEVVKAILKHAAERRPIIFAASVLAAHDIADLLSESGMRAEAVTGAMSYDERQPIYKRYRTGETRALVTVQVLTEGADFPCCDCVVIARPTQSQNLYSQMAGRSLRLYEDKEDALILDLVGTARVLKLITLTNLDAGVPVKKVDTEGEELPPEDDEEMAADPLEGLAVPKQRRMGPINTIEIDLLGEDETSTLWLGTEKGVPFMSPPECEYSVFLWETAPGLYRVATMTNKGDKAGSWVTEEPKPIEIAKDIAEDFVTDAGYSLPLRTASWRKSAPPSQAQLRFARTLGINEAEEMTKARLSDEISIILMSRRLDKAR